MFSTRFHDEVHLAGRGHFAKTPGLAGANSRKENPGGRGGAQTTLTGKGQERISKVVLNTPGYNDGQLEPKRLFKGGKVEGQQTQSISRAFALLDKTNKTPHPKSRKAVSIMTPVAGSAKKANLKASFTPAPPQAAEAAVRPSAGRLSIRAPRLSQTFETPDARGRRSHWDVGDVDPGPDMDEHVQASNEMTVEGAEVEEEEEEFEYMPPTAIVPDYAPLFDMPDMKSFGQAVISLTHSYWPKDEVDILSTIRDDELIDSRFNQPSCHDLSMLDPPEDNPFPVRKSPSVLPAKPGTRGRSATISNRQGTTSTPPTRPASVAAVRAPTARAPSRTSNRPASTVPANSATNTRPPSTVPPKSDVQTTRAAIRRPGTAPGIRPGESTARVAGKIMVPKRAEAKTALQSEPQTYLVEALAVPVSQLELDDEFLFDVSATELE